MRNNKSNLHSYLEWYLCENVCVSHEPNLKGNVKWNMSIRTVYSMDALPYQCAMWSNGGPEAWRYKLYFPMLLLVISVGRDWTVHSILEFSAMKKNLRIISDMERVFWTVLFRMASFVFLFFTPSVSSLVRN